MTNHASGRTRGAASEADAIDAIRSDHARLLPHKAVGASELGAAPDSRSGNSGAIEAGVKIGNVYCGAPMYADDLALIASSPHELQAMIDIVSQ